MMPIPDEFKIIPDDLAICVPLPTESEQEGARKIRREFLIEGQPEPYVDDFVRAFRRLKGLRTYLEVGIFDRGNLAYLSGLLADDALLIGVGAQEDEGRDALLRAKLKPGQQYAFIKGDSRRPETAAAVSEILSGRALDAAFIDGDHTAYGVMCDFTNYRPLLRRGGLMMFHDCLWEGDATFKGACDALAEIDKLTPIYLVPGSGDCRRFMRPLFRDPIWGVVGFCFFGRANRVDSAAADADAATSSVCEQVGASEELATERCSPGGSIAADSPPSPGAAASASSTTIGRNYKYWRQEGRWWRGEYERRMRSDPLYPIQTVVIAALFSNCAPMRVAEFGCGTGRHIAYVRNIEGIEVFGIDQSPAMVDAIRAFVDPDWFESHIRLVEPTGALPFPDSYFDVVFTCEAVIHVSPEDLQGRLAELIRIARKGTFHLEPAPDCPIHETAHFGSWAHDIIGAYQAIGFRAEALAKPCYQQQPVFCSKDGAWRPPLTDAFLEQCAALQEVFKGR
jgi:SAM-dependent methyltransferase